MSFNTLPCGTNFLLTFFEAVLIQPFPILSLTQEMLHYPDVYFCFDLSR